MTRVDFYVLADGAGRERELTACRIVEKAWQQGHTVWLTTEDQRQAERMDQLLWTFRDSSFVPHERGPAESGVVGIVPYTERHTGGVLVNVANAALLPLERAARIAEIIPADADGRSYGRQRFRAYRDAGAEPETHNL
ncbi:MAG: DNA polymerase III subunit chi [Pseudomonadota bacterium]